MERERIDHSQLESSTAGDRSVPHRFFLTPDGLLRPIFRLFLSIALGFLLLLSLELLVFRVMPGPARGLKLSILYVLFDGGLLLEAWFFLRALDRRSFHALGLWFYPGWVRELILGVGVGAGLFAVIVAGLIASRAVAYYGFAGAEKHTLLAVSHAGGLMVLAAIFEELVFRGYAFQRLVDSVGPVVGVSIVSAVFGAAHLHNPSATPLSTANTVLAGVLLSAAYLKTRGLWLPIGLHWAWNFVMGPIFSLPVSGINFGPGLFHFEITGSKWLTGGTYGPEGGAALTIACVPVIIWLASTRRVTPSPAMEEVLK